MSFIEDTWAPALESEQYAQTTAALKTEKGFCCLGLGLELLGVPSIPICAPRGDDRAYFFGNNTDSAMPDKQQLKMLGISKYLAQFLAGLNDKGIDFPTIGRFLRTRNLDEIKIQLDEEDFNELYLIDPFITNAVKEFCNENA